VAATPSAPGSAFYPEIGASLPARRTLAGLEPIGSPRRFLSHSQERDMTTAERDAWLDEVMQARPTGMHFKTAWIIACALYRGDGNALALSKLEREGGEACRRSMQRAIRWLEGKRLLRVEPGVHGSAPRRYTLLSNRQERAAA
jgi:hypothetical protein